MKTVIVAAGVVIEGGRVLVSQRKADGHLAGLWEFPGGKVEPGEDPRDAVRRELAEELGVDAAIGRVFDVAFHRYDAAPGGPKAVLLLFYEAHLREGSPPPRPIDAAAVRWATADELDPGEFPPADVDMLREVRARLTT